MWIVDKINWFLSSWENNDSGASTRKMNATFVMLLIGWLHMKVEKEHILSFLIVDVSFILLLYGILQVDQVIAFLKSKS